MTSPPGCCPSRACVLPSPAATPPAAPRLPLLACRSSLAAPLLAAPRLPLLCLPLLSSFAPRFRARCLPHMPVVPCLASPLMPHKTGERGVVPWGCGPLEDCETGERGGPLACGPLAWLAPPRSHLLKKHLPLAPQVPARQRCEHAGVILGRGLRRVRSASGVRRQLASERTREPAAGPALG